MEESREIEDDGEADNVGVPRENVDDGDLELVMLSDRVPIVASVLPEGVFESDGSAPEAVGVPEKVLVRSFDGVTVPASPPLRRVTEKVLDGDLTLTLVEYDGERENEPLSVIDCVRGDAESLGEPDMVAVPTDTVPVRLGVGERVNDNEPEKLRVCSCVGIDREIVNEAERERTDAVKSLV